MRGNPHNTPPAYGMMYEQVVAATRGLVERVAGDDCCCTTQKCGFPQFKLAILYPGTFLDAAIPAAAVPAMDPNRLRYIIEGRVQYSGSTPLYRVETMTGDFRL